MLGWTQPPFGDELFPAVDALWAARIDRCEVAPPIGQLDPLPGTQQPRHPTRVVRQFPERNPRHAANVTTPLCPQAALSGLDGHTKT